MPRVMILAFLAILIAMLLIKYFINPLYKHFRNSGEDILEGVKDVDKTIAKRKKARKKKNESI